MMTHTLFPAMRRQRLALGFIAAVLGQPLIAGAVPGASIHGHVFTANEQGNSVSRIDLSSGQVATVSLPIAPHNVQATPDMAKLLIVGTPAQGGHGGSHGHGDDHGSDAGRLLVLDPAALDAPPVEITVGSHPAHVVTDREGLRAFVTNAGDDSISVVDLASRSVRTIRAAAYPHGLRLSPDGRLLLVANVKDGSVSLFDTDTLVETARIPVGASPVQVAFLPDGAQAYVSLRDEDAMAVIDIARRKVSGRIPVGDGPIQSYSTPDGGRLFVANQGSEQAPGNQVSVIDVAKGAVVATVKVGQGAHGVVVSADGSRAFITNVDDGTVSEIRTGTNQVLATHTVGRGPNGITYTAR